MNNRIHNATNPNQGNIKRVLCCCSAGLLRSPTAAMVLSQEPYNYNTRAGGLEPSYALIPIDEVLVYWADEIVCMTEDQESYIQMQMANKVWVTKPIICLYIADSFAYRDPELIKRIKDSYPKD